MKKSRYSDSQILAILKHAETGTPVPQLCREHGMNSATFYLIRLTANQRNWGLWAVLSVPAQGQRLWLEPQARVPDLPASWS
jgi:putative transposase